MVLCSKMLVLSKEWSLLVVVLSTDFGSPACLLKQEGRLDSTISLVTSAGWNRVVGLFDVWFAVCCLVGGCFLWDFCVGRRVGTVHWFESVCCNISQTMESLLCSSQ